MYLNAKNAGSKQDAHKKYYDSGELADKVFKAYAITGEFKTMLAKVIVWKDELLESCITDMLMLMSWDLAFCKRNFAFSVC